MVELGYTGSSSQRMTKADIQRLIKNMKRSTKRLPKIQKKATASANQEKKIAEQQLDSFLNL